MKERLDSRVLGALRWIDGGTGLPIERPLRVTGEGLRFIVNKSGLCVVSEAKGLDKYQAAYDPKKLQAPEKPADGSLSFKTTVEDPLGDYLPRVYTLLLPRNLSAANTAGSTFAPIEVVLFPAPGAKVPVSAAQVRLSAVKTGGKPVPNLLLRIVKKSAPATVLGRGMTDARGEALVLVPGLKLFEPGNTPQELVTSKTEALVQAFEPKGAEPIVDWTTQETGTPKQSPRSLLLTAGGRFSLSYPFQP